jgi:hypothetical protein
METKPIRFARLSRQRHLFSIAGGILILGLAPAAVARVATIVIDAPASAAYGGALIGSAGSHVTLSGRVFGELDPHNQVKLGKGRE